MKNIKQKIIYGTMALVAPVIIGAYANASSLHDLDGDNRIDLTEVYAAAGIYTQKGEETKTGKEISKRFQKADLNNDGYLDIKDYRIREKQELESALNQLEKKVNDLEIK